MRKRFTNPYLLLNQSNDDGGGGIPKPTPPAGENDKGKQEPAFPADTAVKDMTADQQAAYWKHQARKHENRVKEYGTLTPEQARKATADAEEARKKSLSDSDRAIEEAREAARTETATTAAKREAETALKIALRGRSIDGAAAFSRPDFVKDGAADVEAILEWVDENSQVSGVEPQGGAGNDALRRGAGDRERMKTTGRATGRAEAEKRFGKKS
ncbi:hypothetical protein [Glutamicibacter sp. AOP3-A1-12]|uniref:hypothetical protein n=1 Tax=Glutamicibacter sp. AOP3-A1-12 TaxID=3457701 RepID=UPI004033CD36